MTESPKATTENRLVLVSPRAQEQVRKLIQAEEGEGIGLRLAVKGGGCSGLRYSLEFTPVREGDTVIDYDGFQIFLDPKSTIYLTGVLLDYDGGLSGKGFTFTNPMARNTCGCGESFSI